MEEKELKKSMENDKARPSKNINSEEKFDISLDDLRSDVTLGIGLEHSPAPISVRKPKKNEFFRVNPDENYRIPVKILEIEEPGEMQKSVYLVAPKFEGIIEASLIDAELRIVATRTGDVFIWPLKFGGRTNKWQITASEAAKEAELRWVRIYADTNLGCYRIVKVDDNLVLPEAEFPDEDFGEIIKRAFGNRLVFKENHPLFNQLKGAE
jgi:hypothetical protein